MGPRIREDKGGSEDCYENEIPRLRCATIGMKCHALRGNSR